MCVVSCVRFCLEGQEYRSLKAQVYMRNYCSSPNLILALSGKGMVHVCGTTRFTRKLVFMVDHKIRCSYISWNSHR